MRRAYLACFILALGAAGCHVNSPEAGGQTGGEGIGCLPVATTPLTLDQQSPLGFSAAQVLMAIGTTHSGPLGWAKGGMTTFTVTVALADGPLAYVDREWKDDGSEMATAPGYCSDVIQIPATIGFQTADGAFDESYAGDILAETASSASYSTAIDLSALDGSYVVTEVNPADYDSVAVWLAIAFTSADVHGTVSGQATMTSNADGTASATNFDVATF